MSNPVIIRSFEQYKQTVKSKEEVVATETVEASEELAEELVEEVLDIPLSSISATNTMDADSGFGFGTALTIFAFIALLIFIGQKLLTKGLGRRKVL